ncbi:tripartite tricarboxylate transporter TctB family protein [Chachezhania antarctica]|uniref:tripartite tricarboxylate transporter TctB family protein n=1 Tax=Chachezhania antarctica TaxID=2340860 RepID=UPI000EB1A8EB|nr:tripartite tricarboxylate transporter TctB family protein [Chachezhania antarctica]|tara:strand:- start:10999 stop:11478 length:480 start_codon:yes stop_codon:yes gene_type:complete
MSAEDTRPPHRIAGFNTLELAAGLIIFVVGLIVAFESLSYSFGTLRNVGPAVFPMLLGFTLAALGLAIVFEGRTSLAVAPYVPWRAVLAICAALGAFALLIDTAGAYVAIFALIFLAGLADRPFRPVTLLCVALGLCAFITALVLGLRGIVNIDLLPGA